MRFEIEAPRKLELRVETRDGSESRVARFSAQSACTEP
jgi:hypothetical protein